MKVLFHVSLLLLLLISAGCSWDGSASAEPIRQGDAEQADPLSAQAPASNTIGVTGPITISRNPLFHLTGKDEYLSVVQVSGVYYEDWTPGAAMGRTWDGEFLLQLTDASGEVKSSHELNPYFHDDVTFHSFFDIEFDDYNGDGNLDFTIGQYATSNGNIYQLFTLEQSGSIKALPIEGHPVLFVSNGTGRYTTKLAKTKNGFMSSYYDNQIGEHVQQTFVWNGEAFVEMPFTGDESSS